MQSETETPHAAPLGDDDVPDENQAHLCFSCEAPIKGLYCDACGQKNDNYRRSIIGLISETFGTVFGFESRIWKTWASLLFRPGRVAREFTDGARSKWSSPVRVYIAMSVILFGYLGCTQTQIIALDIKVTPQAEFEKATPPLTDDQMRLLPSLHFFETQKEIDARNAQKDLEQLRRMMNNGVNFDISLGETEDDNPVLPSGETKASEGLRINGVNGENTVISTAQMSKFMLQIVRNPDIINGIFMVWIPRLMFFMMPFTMLLGAFFIRGPNALLFDHLVHSAYIHAVTFLLILLCLLAAKIIPGGLAFRWAGILMLIYLPLSLKHMFKRGWTKTILASYGVGFSYILVFTVLIFVIFAIEITGVVTGIAGA